MPKNGVYYRKSLSLNKLKDKSSSSSISNKFIFFIIDVAVLFFCFVMFDGENNIFLTVGLVALVLVPFFLLSFIVDGIKGLIRMFKEK